MTIIELLLLSIGLAMDAFAVSICKGLEIKSVKFKELFIVGLYFGFFQALMPVLGFFLGFNFQYIISPIDHWIVFILLSVIGFNMIKETFNNNRFQISNSIDLKEMIILSIATSIDALAVGITFAFLKVSIIQASLIIGIVTLIISMIGVKVGSIFGNKYEKKAQLIGGIILILLGFKILLEHLIV